MPQSLPANLSVVLVEDHRASRRGIVALLGASAGARVLAAAALIEGVLHAVHTTHPDIVLLHLGGADDAGLALAGALHGQDPASRLIVLGASGQGEPLRRLVRAGVSGFVMAGATRDEFQATLRAVAAGIQVLPPGLAGALFAQLADAQTDTVPGELLGVRGLTPRERQVHALVSTGVNARGIATRLGIAPSAATRHVRTVLTKLGGAARFAVTALAPPRRRVSPAII